MLPTTYTVCCNCTLNPTKFISLQVFFKLQILSLTCWIHHKSSLTRVWCSFVQNNMLFRFMVYWHRIDLTFVGSSLSAATCIGTTLTIFCQLVPGHCFRLHSALRCLQLPLQQFRCCLKLISKPKSGNYEML